MIPVETIHSPPLLDDDAYRAARLVALAMLERVRAARARLADATDASALHDFRVAVRRLRSWLTLQRGLLQGSSPKRAGRWLRRLAQATNPSRDDEVFAAWLTAERPLLVPRHRAAADWILDRIARHRRRAERALGAEVDRDLDRVCDLLGERLRIYAVPHHVAHGPLATAFAVEMAALMRAQAAMLRRRLRAIRGAADAAAVHRARIAGKRLRYLLEPVVADLADGTAVVERLKCLQDLLGDHHDAHVWLDTVRAAASQAPRVALRHGLEAIVARIAMRAADRFVALAGEWLVDEPPLFADIERATAALEARVVRGVEVERKFLLAGMPAALPKGRMQLIEQGYLPGERLIERVRRVREGRAVRHLRTVKGGAGIARIEIEEPCTARLFAALWPLTGGRRVTKRRHLVVEGEREWAVDEFTDRELVLAEVELPSPDTEIALPAWLAPLVVREVTDEPAYVNAVLAR